MHDLFGSLFFRTPPASIQFLVVAQADFIAKGVIVSEIDVELTSQTVVFAFFLFIEREATIAEALQFSNEQGLRVRVLIVDDGSAYMEARRYRD